MNHLRIEASILEIGVIRYTPIGFPVIDITLSYAGAVKEAGMPRHVEFSMPAVAIGPISEKIIDLGLDRRVLWLGFLAKKHRNSSIFLFHITALQEIEKD
ncbi:primosomal replication protein N [Candidatus Pandoraea novymonadis]|uniref:Replication restart protein PriB n=1 Tax=Candidatus Pandoraea novymonadis TaxID=1808959 RepID=A0ABX5FDM8_9BURK|nr:primosomal replication protein N [Candidatus Pandoraea novymonadis]PSB91810.1 Primosomal replication protein n [Candidatus Pandoraea novymonadis]